MGLDNLRNEINLIDDQIIHLFDKRMAVVKQVGEYKAVHGLAINHPEREKEILDKIASKSEYSKHAKDVFEVLMRVSKELQSEITIG